MGPFSLFADGFQILIGDPERYQARMGPFSLFTLAAYMAAIEPLAYQARMGPFFHLAPVVVSCGEQQLVGIKPAWVPSSISPLLQ